MQKITRRRMISITAAAGGAALLGTAGTLKAASVRPLIWQGSALGAEAQLVFYHQNRKKTQDILEQCLSEITRLEKIFSLYQEDSQIRILNRNGRLDNPAFELLELVSRSQQIGKATQGAFDITVQPLWQFYTNHFAVHTDAPLPEKLAQVQKLVDYQNIEITPQKISFKRKNMGITLNGIAQGYITDSIKTLLQQNGWHNVLIDLGEIYAMGRKENAPWQVGIATPSQKVDKRKIAAVQTLALENCALATSGSYGTKLSANGDTHHLFDPHTGQSTQNFQSVSVKAPDATTADALSTSFSAMPLPSIKKCMKQFSAIKVIIMCHNDKVITL